MGRTLIVVFVCLVFIPTLIVLLLDQYIVLHIVNASVCLFLAIFAITTHWYLRVKVKYEFELHSVNRKIFIHSLNAQTGSIIITTIIVFVELTFLIHMGIRVESIYLMLARRYLVIFCLWGAFVLLPSKNKTKIDKKWKNVLSKIAGSQSNDSSPVAANNSNTVHHNKQENQSRKVYLADILRNQLGLRLFMTYLEYEFATGMSKLSTVGVYKKRIITIYNCT